MPPEPNPNPQSLTPAPAEYTLVGQLVRALMNIWTFLAVTVVCITLFGICFLIADIAKKSDDPGRILGTIAGFFSKQAPPRAIEARVYKFWTPSERTADAVRDKIPAEKLPWYTLEGGDATLQQFGNDLVSTLGAQGYSRYEGYGQATAPLKPGWTWEMTVTEGNEKFTIPAFLDLYQRYFKRDRDVYLEITDIGTKTRQTIVKTKH